MEMLSTENPQDVSRPLRDYPPSVWGCTFDSFNFSSTDSEFQSRTQEVELLREKVKDMLMQSTRNPSEKIEFINLLCRLGVSYHFETEIENQLSDLFIEFQNLHEDNHYELYTLALAFRVLRQHGFKMSCDVFKKFKGSDGEFKKSITTDVKGLLSLYEASFLSFNGEDILDEALDFTKRHLEISVEKSSPHLGQYIKNALNLPLHHGLGRVETLKYISFYEEEESRNETLLKFVKLDYNRLQLLYKKELALLSRWWKDLNIPENIPYARDRIVECYIWAVGMQFEPQYSFGRLIGTKYIQMVSLLDDTFDSYGTIDELQCFTAAFQRCSSVDAIDQLPNYMKFLYKTIFNLFAETDNNKNEGIRYRTSFAKEKLKEIVRSYFKEAQWLLSKEYVPSFDEYEENGLVTGTGGIVPAGILIGIEEIGINEYQWMETNPKLFKAIQFIGRFKNDIMSHGYQVEKNKGGCTLAVQSYMKHYSVSEEEAIEEIKKMCNNKWKDINEEYCLKPRDVSMIILKNYVEFARLTVVFYNGVDYYTHASYLVDVVASLFIDPIQL